MQIDRSSRVGTIAPIITGSRILRYTLAGVDRKSGETERYPNGTYFSGTAQADRLEPAKNHCDLSRGTGSLATSATRGSAERECRKPLAHGFWPTLGSSPTCCIQFRAAEWGGFSAQSGRESTEPLSAFAVPPESRRHPPVCPLPSNPRVEQGVRRFRRAGHRIPE